MTSLDEFSRIEFFQHHIPAITPGEYTVNINQEVKHAGVRLANIPATEQQFAVLGERFTLNPQEVKGMFPAPGSTGEYSAILPHIIFERRTLPWERSAIAENNSPETHYPWLALLLFDEDEIPEKEIVSIADIETDDINFPDFAKEISQKEEDKLTIIKVEKTVLEKVLPSKESLLLSSHTRKGVSYGNELREEHAIVVCNRLPALGKRSTMHLVSLENRYDASGFIYPESESPVNLVSLKSWEFYTLEHFKITQSGIDSLVGVDQEIIAEIGTLLGRDYAGSEATFIEEIQRLFPAFNINEIDDLREKLLTAFRFNKTFDGLLMNLDKDLLTLRLPTHTDEVAESYYKQGLIPMEHQFRNGDSSVSWYRGPLSPIRNEDSERLITLDTMPVEPAVVFTIQDQYAETADDLLRFDEVSGMFDATYSSAWEVGRLLALADKDFSASLYQWKRLIRHEVHLTTQRQEQSHFPLLAQPSEQERANHLWNNHIVPWCNRLISLDAIPANYLIPDERLLEKETIRFFSIDHNWLQAAISGAFSVGGSWEKEQQEANPKFKELLELKSVDKMGCVLRSDVVDGWPGLSVDGVCSINISAARQKRLSKNVCLYFFEDTVNSVVFHQKPEMMHFGLTNSSGHFSKRKRKKSDDSTNGEETLNTVEIPWKDNDPTLRLIDMNMLANELDEGDDPARFAMNMVEGTPRVIFHIGLVCHPEVTDR